MESMFPSISLENQIIHNSPTLEIKARIQFVPCVFSLYFRIRVSKICLIVGHAGIRCTQGKCYASNLGYGVMVVFDGFGYGWIREACFLWCLCEKEWIRIYFGCG